MPAKKLHAEIEIGASAVRVVAVIVWLFKTYVGTFSGVIGRTIEDSEPAWPRLWRVEDP